MDARMVSDYSSKKFCSINYKHEDRICVNETQADYVKYVLQKKYLCECGPDCLTNNYKVRSTKVSNIRHGTAVSKITIPTV